MKAPAFQFYVRDWLCSPTVMNMSGEGVKAFIYLLCASWLQKPRATLPNDENQLAKMACLNQHNWDIIKQEVMSCFILVDGRWVNERLMEVSRRSEVNEENGLKGGNPNFKKGRRNPYYPKHNPKDNPLGNLEDNPNDNPVVEEEEEEEVRRRSSAPKGTGR